MEFQPFGGEGVLISTIRLLLAAVAIVHAMLCLRVVLMRAWRALRRDEVAHVERVPTAAMVAYGVLTANIGRLLLLRIPGAPPLNWLSVGIYSAALIAGTVAFTQIVVFARRGHHLPLR